MSSTPLHTEFEGIAQLRDALQSRKISARELAASALAAAEARADLNAFLHIDHDLTLAQADEADRQLAGGGQAPALAGIPIAHKDVFVTRGWRTTAASKMLAQYISRSEEHTSELQSLMRISYAVFCLKNKIPL